MAFKVTVAGMEELGQHQYLTEVVVERHLYEHTSAQLTWRWKEDNHYGERPTAMFAAKSLNCPVDVEWKDNDLAESLNCFHGYVENTSGQRDAVGSRLTLSCVSYSKRTDLVPRHRAYQATTLLDIAQQVAKTEPLVKIINAGDLAKPVPLSLQYLETDYQYLSRMLHAWGVPMSVVDRTGEVNLGARGQEADQPFPDVNFGWAEVSFAGSLQTLPQAPSGGSGPTSVARQQLSEHLAQLSRRTADYMQAPERPNITTHVSDIKGHNDVSGYYLRLEGLVLPFQPGQVVSFEGQQHLIHRTRIAGHPDQTTATQEFWLQPLTQPLPPERERPHWPSRGVWAHVTANEHDPLQQGRIQVEFEWEHLDPQPGGDRVWLHLLTPYGGGFNGGKKSNAYSGFYSVPEVGERVLVEFLGDWDSEAVILGTMRHTSQQTAHNPKHTKRWSTPEGNEIAMTSRGSDHVLRMRNQNKLVFEAHMDGNGGHSASFMSGGSDEDSIHITVNKGNTMVEIRGSKDMVLYARNNMHIQSDEHLHLQAKSITLHSNGPGGVKVEAQAEDISLNALAGKVVSQGQAGVNMSSLTGKVGTQGAQGVDIHAGAGTVRVQGGPNILLNAENADTIPNLPAPVPSPLKPSS